MSESVRSTLKNAVLLIVHAVTLRLGEVFTSLQRLGSSPWLVGLLLGGFLLSYVLYLYADRRMSAVFSEFWHKAQLDLRRGLKRARTTAMQTLPSKH
jgi:hypothetical protein